MRHSFNGKRYRINFVAPSKLNSKCDGDCDSPDTKNKQIRVSKKLSPKRELEVLIHEAIHAELFLLDEDTVSRSAEDLAALLWRLGYRRKGD